MSGVARVLAGLCFLQFVVQPAATVAHAKRLVPIEADATTAGGLEVFVKDEKGSAVHAQVWVETRDGKVLAEIDAADGHVAAPISDTDLAQGVSITAYAPGFSALSLLENGAHRVALELMRSRTDSYGTLSGLLTGFEGRDGFNTASSHAVLGLVGKAFAVDDLVELDLGSFLSPTKDTIDVFGQRQIPSNIVLPDQSVTYILLPIHLSKPFYRLPVPAGSSSRYFSMTGKIGVGDALGALKDNKPWDLINAIDFSRVGVTAPIGVGPEAVRFDLSTDADVEERYRLRPGRNLSQGESRRLAVAVWQPAAGVFVPTDLKLVGSGDLSLKAIATGAGESKLLDVLIGNDGMRFRGAWVPQDATALPDTGFTAQLSLSAIDGDWVVGGAENAQLFTAHLEEFKVTQVGGKVYEDRWTVVGPNRGHVHLPVAAAKVLLARLGTISHVSVDLLQTTAKGYPLIKGANSASELTAFEKVRKKL